MKKRIFLDHASITPVDPVVEKEMQSAQKKFWANPSSIHSEGIEAGEALEEARKRIARILHCRASEIHFTSGGTESLNIAIFGICREDALLGKHVISSTIEHPAVLEPLKFLASREEIELTLVTPDQKGIVNPESIKKEIKANTVLIAIQHANNEIGTIQPIREISRILKEPEKTSPQPLHFARGGASGGVVLLVDASQSVLYEDISIERLGADILVIDGIKMYGPRGMGVLAVKHGIRLAPTFYGGGQEGGLRSGTQNVPGACGMAKALEMAANYRDKESARLRSLRDYAVAKILNEIPNSSLNGDLQNRLPNNINICLRGQDSEFLVIKLDTLGFAVSAASACHTLALENSSYVVASVSGKECASSSLRLTLGRQTSKSDLDKFISALSKIAK